MKKREYVRLTCECGNRRIRANFMVCNACHKSICNVCWHGTCPHCGNSKTINTLKRIAADLHKTPEEDRDGWWLHDFQLCRKLKVDIPGIPDDYDPNEVD